MPSARSAPTGWTRHSSASVDGLQPGGRRGVGRRRELRPGRDHAHGCRGLFLSRDLWLDKNIMGCRYGSAQPHHDIPTYIKLYRAGQMLLDEMVTNVYPIDDVERAFQDMADSTIARTVLAISDVDG